MAVRFGKKTYEEITTELSTLDAAQFIQTLFADLDYGSLGCTDPYYNEVWQAYRERGKQLIQDRDVKTPG